jgi:hypothetical protein
MRKVVFLLAIAVTLAVGTFSLQGASSSARKQMALAQFDKPVLVQGQVLKGQYLFVHDDVAMQRGEACTYIYKGDAPVRDRLVVSFHCIPAERAPAVHFVFRTAEETPGVLELREFQFAGDTEAHIVPVSHMGPVGHIGTISN